MWAIGWACAALAAMEAIRSVWWEIRLALARLEIHVLLAHEKDRLAAIPTWADGIANGRFRYSAFLVGSLCACARFLLTLAHAHAFPRLCISSLSPLAATVSDYSATFAAMELRMSTAWLVTLSRQAATSMTTLLRAVMAR